MNILIIKRASVSTMGTRYNGKVGQNRETSIIVWKFRYSKSISFIK